jgi:uncharacterized protein (TIGR02099 family)
MLKRWSFHLARGVIYALVGSLLVVGGAILGLRYWLLPNIDRYRPLIEHQISERLGNHVTIGHIYAEWDGLRPRLELRNLQVLDAQNSVALELVAVDATVAWRSLLLGSLRFSSINIAQPTLEVRRDKSGRLFVAGVPIEPKHPGGGLTDWLLDQRDIFISGAVFSWEDQQSDTQPLVLDGVSLHLQNRGKWHHFGLVARPPAQLAGKIDVRGDLRRDAKGGLAEWSGRLYADLPYVEGAAWRRYLPLPPSFQNVEQGRGAGRLWLEFEGERIQTLTADVTLSDIAARFDEKLPVLDLASLSGRLRYRALGEGFEIGAEKLAFTARGSAAVNSTDFTFRSTPERVEQPAEGELRANHLQLAVLASLVEYLPVDPELRTKVGQYAPSGTVSDLTFQWAGKFPLPAKYSLKGKVAHGAFKAVGSLPGVSGLGAAIVANERSGTIAIDAKAFSLHLPKVFAVPLDFDSFAAKVAWQRNGSETEIQLSQVGFANKDLAGNVSGNYRAVAEGPGIIDLTGGLRRVQAHTIGTYLPLQLHERLRVWLESAILDGKADEASLRLVGDLRKFPFSDEKHGQFLVRANVSGGTLEYSPSWPRIENIKCDLLFQGNRMHIAAKEGSVFGAKLANVTAVIQDLGSRDPVLGVNGNASGPVAEKLRFINASPVKDSLGNAIEGLIGEGSGKLALKLSIPLNHARDTKVEGDYDFINAGLKLGPDGLAINGIDGRLQFSEKQVQGRGISAQILDGPVTIDVTSQSGGVVIDGRGRVAIRSLQGYVAESVLRYVQGNTEWQGELRLEKSRSELKLTAPLAGTSSSLPEPFAKAKDDVWPLTLKRQVGEGKPELTSISFAQSIYAELERIRGSDGKLRVKRASLSFGSAASLPGEDGLWISGRLAALDLDRWKEVLKTDSGDGGDNVAIRGIDLTVGLLKTYGRAFGTLQVAARAQNDGWSGSLAGQAIRGDFSWRPAGQGVLQARLKELNIPESTAKKPPAAKEPRRDVPSEGNYPAMDIVADSLQFEGKKFGRLELNAAPVGQDWRIEHLRLTQAEVTLDADGMWRRTPPVETRLKLKLDSSDVGKLMAALGYPDSVKAGKAELVGEISWPGGPPDMALGKLSGDLSLDARSGQFVKIQPGAGKLLGLISLQSLPRRFAFDFRDIFSEGFSFDSITGTMKIRDGVLDTRDFVISGSSARVEMSGDVNLANETQHLRVKVIPTLSEGLSLATGIFGGPVAGVATLLVQKMLNNPIGRAAGYEYNVSGTWDNPIVAKGEQPALPPTNSQP